MKLKQYVEIIEKTAVFPDTVNNFGVAYSLIGALDEYTEFLDVFEDLYEKNIHKSKANNSILAEAGDVIWYITALGLESKVAMSEVFVKSSMRLDITNPYRQIFRYIGGNVKKFYRDGKELNEENFVYCLKLLYNCVHMICDMCDIDMADVREYNYNKLMKRRETNTLHGDGDYREKE